MTATMRTIPEISTLMAEMKAAAEAYLDGRETRPISESVGLWNAYINLVVPPSVLLVLAECERLQTEADDDDALRTRMSNLLSRTVVAVRGEHPEPHTYWSWHDLPEWAALLKEHVKLTEMERALRTGERDLARAKLADAEAEVARLTAQYIELTRRPNPSPVFGLSTQ